MFRFRMGPGLIFQDFLRFPGPQQQDIFEEFRVEGAFDPVPL